MSNGPSTGWPTWRRRHVLAMSAAAAGATAGCLDGLFGGSDPDSVAPASANVIGRVDPVVLEDEPSRQLLQLVIDEGPEIPALGLLEGFIEGSDDVPPLEAVSEATLVAALDEALSTDLLLAGALIETEWSEDQIMGLVEGAVGVEYQAGSHQGEEVLYEPTAPVVGDPVLVGMLESGFVTGDEPAVTGVLDVAMDDADVIDGDIIEALDAAPDGDGAIAFAPPVTLLPESLEGIAESAGVNKGPFEEVETVNGSYEASGQEVSVEINIFASDSGAASSLEALLGGAQVLIAGELEGAVATEFERPEIGAHPDDNAAVQITYESDATGAALLLEEILQFITGDEGGDDDAPSAVPAEADGFGTIEPDVLVDGGFQDVSASLIGFLQTQVDGPEAEALSLMDLTQFEPNTGLSLSAVSSLVGFSRLHEDVLGVPEALGVVLTADWELSAVVDGIGQFTGASLEATTHGGEEVLYEPSGDGIVHVGHLAEGEFVIGDRPGVEAALDVARGDAATISGPALEQYEAAGSGALVGGLELRSPPVISEDPPIDLSSFDDVETVSARYEQDGTATETDATVGVATATSAADVVSLVTLMFDQFVEGPDLEAETEKLDFQQTDATIEMAYRSDVEGVSLLLDNLSGILPDF